MTLTWRYSVTERYMSVTHFPNIDFWMSVFPDEPCKTDTEIELSVQNYVDPHVFSHPPSIFFHFRPSVTERYRERDERTNERTNGRTDVRAMP